MHHYELCEITGAGKQSRYYANGKRITKDSFDYIVIMAIQKGTLSCSHTKCKPVNDSFRRWNYSIATF